jgi:hypothetical protein
MYVRMVPGTELDRTLDGKNRVVSCRLKPVAFDSFPNFGHGFDSHLPHTVANLVFMVAASC